MPSLKSLLDKSGSSQSKPTASEGLRGLFDVLRAVKGKSNGD